MFGDKEDERFIRNFLQAGQHHECDRVFNTTQGLNIKKKKNLIRANDQL